jgi:hypothetical protein
MADVIGIRPDGCKGFGISSQQLVACRIERIRGFLERLGHGRGKVGRLE